MVFLEIGFHVKKLRKMCCQFIKITLE